MILPQEDTHRFYRIWLALLSYANAKLQIVSNWPREPQVDSVAPADVAKIRDALWADDGLREAFIVENPAGLSSRHRGIVSSWKHRLSRKARGRGRDFGTRF